MEKMLIKRNAKRNSRTKRVRRALKMRGSRPRLSILKTNKHLFAQLIDDDKGVSLLGLGTRSKALREIELGQKSKASAEKIGELLAAKAKAQGIEKVYFDRGPYKYHGIVSILAEAARKHGLIF
mgnify:CR=1 FL=1